MKNKSTILIIVLLIAVFLVGGTLLYRSLNEQYLPENTLFTSKQNSSENSVTGISEANTNSQSEERNTAPDFTVLDMNGNEVSLSDFYGTPIIINFWATWCGPCQSEMTHFDALYQEYGDDVIFMMVNLTDGTADTISSVKEFIADEGYTFPVYFDTEYNGSTAYAISSIPQTIAIDKNGNIATQRIGTLTENALLAMINSIK